jgi:hypothetical protein
MNIERVVLWGAPSFYHLGIIPIYKNYKSIKGLTPQFPQPFFVDIFCREIYK